MEICDLLPKKSVDMFMTSPPYYNMRVYRTGGRIWDEDKNCKHVWNLVKKKVHNGRGDAQSSGKYSEQNPVKDEVVKWEYCKNCTAVKCQLGQENTSDLYIRHLCDVFDKVYEVLKDDGSLYVNIGDSKYKGSDLNVPHRFAEEMKKRGWIQKRCIVWWKPNVLGNSDKRNYVIDYEYLFFFVKSQKKYYFDMQYEPYAESTLKQIGKKYDKETRFKDPNIQDPSDVKRRKLKSIEENIEYNEVQTEIAYGGKNFSSYGNPIYSGRKWKSSKKGRFRRSVWRITTKSFGSIHKASYPYDLCIIPILSSCREGGIVCDVFSGTGTTGIVARELGRDFINIEISSDYIDTQLKKFEKYDKVPIIKKNRYK